jgi:hypothetical protein
VLLCNTAAVIVPLLLLVWPLSPMPQFPLLPLLLSPLCLLSLLLRLLGGFQATPQLLTPCQAS